MRYKPPRPSSTLPVGGNTNLGAISNNFALLPEYATSATILEIDLAAIGNTTFILSTLDDEDRPGDPDLNDPFGGNNGKNQAILVPGDPVQIYAPGFRNPYDVVITQNDLMYTVDNGSNASWGDVPVSEGPFGNCTNEINEPGFTEGDALHEVLGPGYYGGHPNPTRGNAANTFNVTNPQSAVAFSNPIECDFQTNGTENLSLFVFPASTNGITEYTASNFGYEMMGDLLHASFANTIYRVKPSCRSDEAIVLSEALFSNAGSIPLDVTALGDNDVFPGTVWVADHQLNGGKIIVFEPADFDGGGVPNCTGADDPLLDEDGDGYTNSDEIDNGTDPCSAADGRVR